MLLSKGHLTGRAVDSNLKPRTCRTEIRFHQVPVKCFPPARPLLQCHVSGRWVGCPEQRAGVCLLLSRSQLSGGASGLIRGQLRSSEWAATVELEKVQLSQQWHFPGPGKDTQLESLSWSLGMLLVQGPAELWKTSQHLKPPSREQPVSQPHMREILQPVLCNTGL